VPPRRDDDELDQRITALRAQQLSTQTIADRFGLSKNVVCGRLRRMRERKGEAAPPNPVQQKGHKRSPREESPSGYRTRRLRNGEIERLIDWTPTMLARLKEHCEAGFSDSEIAQRLSVEFGVEIGKNAVVGMRRRKHFAKPAGAPVNATPLSPEQYRKMDELIAKGVSCHKIAAEVGCSQTCANDRRRAAGIKPTRQALPVGAGLPSVIAPAMSPASKPYVSRKPAPKMLPAAPPTPYVAIRVSGAPGHRCLYPIGEVGSEGFRFCDEPAIVSSPYCEKHDRACYQQPLSAIGRRPGWLVGEGAGK
jgi:hypothetical protein